VSGARWALREGVLLQAELARAVLLDARSGEYFEVNESGTVALRALLAGHDAVAAVVAAFEVDAATARADIDALCATLAGRGLLRAADG
jgi:hypothetical protein